MAVSAGDFERDKNGGRNSISIRKHIVVPEAYYAETLHFQPGIARHIVSIFGVLAAIDLDNQSRLKTYKINDIVADLLLPSEFPSSYAFAAQHRP